MGYPRQAVTLSFSGPAGQRQFNHFGQYVMLGLRVPNADIPAYFLMVKR